MTAPRQSRRLPVVVTGIALTSAVAVLAGVGAASLFAGNEHGVVITLFAVTAVVGVVGGLLGAPYIGAAPAAIRRQAESGAPRQ